MNTEAASPASRLEGCVGMKGRSRVSAEWGQIHPPPNTTEPQGARGEELQMSEPHLELGAERSGWRKVEAV